MPEADQHLERLGETAENGDERQQVETQPEHVAVAQIGEAVAQRTDRPQAGGEAENDLDERTAHPLLAGEVAQHRAVIDVAPEGDAPPWGWDEIAAWRGSVRRDLLHRIAAVHHAAPPLPGGLYAPPFIVTWPGETRICIMCTL